MAKSNNTEGAEEWMKDSTKVTERFYGDPEGFKILYPERFAELKKMEKQVIVDDPTWYRKMIGTYLYDLPKYIREAQEGPKDEVIAKLSMIQKGIENILLPSVPMHDLVNAYIHSKESTLKYYHLQVLRLMQEIESSEPEQKKSAILILPIARPALIEELRVYIDQAQHNSLEKLINEGTESKQPIPCQCEQVRLGEIFYERVNENKKDRQIQGDKTKIAQWICRNFSRIEAGKSKNLSYDTILNYLKNKGFPKYK